MLELERQTGESRLNFIEMALVVQLTSSDDVLADIVAQVLVLRERRLASSNKRQFDRQEREAAAVVHQYVGRCLRRCQHRDRHGDPSYLDSETLHTLAYIIRRLRSVVTSKYARHKLANDGTRFGAGQAIVTPSVVRGELLSLYADMEELGIVENAKAFSANLIVERNADDPNRLDVLLPPDLVNQLRIFAVLAQFRLNY